MIKTLKDAIALLKGKRTKDAEGQPLTEEELIGMIDALEKTLQELEGNAAPETTAKAQEIVAQLAELKAQLEASKGAAPPPKPNDDDPAAGGTDDKDARIAALEAENEQLKTENASLKEELEKLKGESDTSSTLNDAKVRFPKVNFNDAKSSRDVRAAVLLSTKVFNDAQVKAMSDDEIRAAYAAVQATSKPRSNIGTHILTDSAQAAKKSASQRFGGK